MRQVIVKVKGQKLSTATPIAAQTECVRMYRRRYEGYTKMEVAIRFVFFAASLYLSFAQEGGPAAVPYSSPDTCAAGEFFQTGNTSCLQCESNQLPAQDVLLCLCESGYIRPVTATADNLQCQACAGQQVTSREGLFCLQCDPSLGYNPQTARCNPCSPTEIYVDTLPSSQAGVGTRSCLSCPEGMWADGSGFQCVECGVSDCLQCSSSTVSGGVCFDSVEQLSQPPAGVFDFYSEHYSAAVELCWRGNQTACQLLANLCVLQMYSTTDPACQMARELATEQPKMPVLYYPAGGADELLESSSVIRTKFAAKEGTDGSSTLPLVVVTFDLRGDLLAVQNVSEQLMLCRDRPSRARAAWRVGLVYQIECSVSVAELSTQAESPVFYDLYLHDEGGGEDRLVPLPVRVTTYRDERGEEVNTDSDRNNWQLVRRFFLSESVTDSPSYARTMRLSVELDSNGAIFPPYLSVGYRSWSPDTESSTVHASFTVEYTQDTSGFDIGISVTVVVLAVVAAVYTGFRVNGFLRRSGITCCELHTFIYLVAELCGSLSTAIFLLLTVAACFWLIFFKAQSTFFLALPIDQQELGFQILLGLALLSRLLHISYLVWHQCTIDIFLIDWERPRGVLLTTNQIPESSAAPTTITAPVSIWRTYFVANEWNEIQSLRKINSTLLLLLAVLFLQVVGFEHLAEQDPSSHVMISEDRYSAPHSSLLRFSLTALHFIVIAIIMRLYVFLFYERFIEHKIRQFVDLCSVSNVSVFIMSRKLFGYYIHGRSVHGHADTNMREMNYNLHKEQENMCGQRGLLADSDDQTFEMALTRQFRIHYDRTVAPIQQEQAEGQANVNLIQRGQGGGRSTGLSEVSLKAYEDMNQFLSAFIERSLRDLDYVVKEKLLLEKALGMEFYDAVDRSLFYNDPRFSFDNVLFYGSEWALFQLDLLVFAVIDLLAQNYILAAILTFIVAWALRFIRDALGRRNLGKKTLVDDRFLI